MPKASTTHADLVRMFMVPSFFLPEESALNALARRRGARSQPEGNGT